MKKNTLLFFAALCLQTAAFCQNVGINVPNPQFPLSFAAVLGDKISLYGDVGNHYGFGIQPYLFQVHTDDYWSDIAFGYGRSNSFTELMRLKGTGKLGIGTNDPLARLHVSNGDVIFSADNDRRLLWYAGNGAFRTGIGFGANWDYDSTGIASFAAGFNVKAIGEASTATGVNTTAKGYSSIASGLGTMSSGWCSSATGDKSIAEGTASFAAGSGSKALADYSGAFGINTIAKSRGAFTVGLYNDDGDPVDLPGTDPMARIFQVGNGQALHPNKPNNAVRSNALTILRNGNVGIGTLSPSQKLHVTGNICATGTISSCSDIRYKKDFARLQHVLPAVLSLNPIYYNWRKEVFPFMGFSDQRQLGFSAQEVEKLFPEIVTTNADGYKAIDYGRLTPVLVESIKEQQQQINDMKKEINELKSLVNKLIEVVGNR